MGGYEDAKRVSNDSISLAVFMVLTFCRLFNVVEGIFEKASSGRRGRGRRPRLILVGFEREEAEKWPGWLDVEVKHLRDLDQEIDFEMATDMET